MSVDWFLALGLLLSTASQLRPGSSPVGLGEVFLVAWSLPVLWRQIASGAVMTPALSVLLRFWSAFVFAESLGYATGLALGQPTDPQWFLHDIMAYPLVAVVSCLMGLQTATTLRRVAWLLALSGTVSLAGLLAAAGGLVRIASMDPWYWDRLRGWSANPNQLALLCAALALVSLHLADTSAGRRERVGAVLCGILPVVVGRMTGSDTFTLMILAAGLVFLGLKLQVWLRSPARALEPRVALALLFFIAIPVFGVSLLPAVLSGPADTGGLAMGLMKNGGKEAHEEADLRLALWQQAVTLGFESGMLGLGPGPHLAIPPSLINARATEAGQPGNITHPENNGAPNFEAHNTILDLFVQGGLLAAASFLWLLGTAILYGWRGGLAGLATLLGCLAFFGMTNLIIRQPLFWFAIVSCLVAGAPRTSPSTPAAAHRPCGKRTAVI